MKPLRTWLGCLPESGARVLISRVRRNTHRRERVAPIARTLLITLAMLNVLSLCSAVAAQSDEPKRVLILMEEDISWPIIRLMDENARETLRQGSPGGILIFSEHLDRAYFLDPSVQSAEERLIKKKYAGFKLDLVMVIGNAPTDWFPGVPLVYLNDYPLHIPPNGVASTTRAASVWIDLDVQKTLEVARRLQPKARQVVVIGQEFSPGFTNRVHDAISASAANMQSIYLPGLTVDEICRRVALLGPESIVLFTGMTREVSGRPLISAEVVPKVAAASGAPVYVLFDTHVGTGATGGYVASFAEIGKAGGELGLRLLAGEHPQDVKVPNMYLFDERQLRRWQLSESALPSGSIVLYRHPTAWESYKHYILGAIFLVVLETLLIFGLLWQRARRKTVETELYDAYDRLRSAMESGKAVGWEWDLKSGRQSWFGDLKTMFGIPSDTYVARPEDFDRYMHSEDRKRVSESVTEAKNDHKAYAAEFRVVWPDGTLRWVAATGKFSYSRSGVPERMLGMAVDITDRKQLKSELHESQDRLGAIIASAMDAIIAIDEAQRIVLLNASAEKMFGCRAQDALGSPIERFIPQRFRAEHSTHIHNFGETGITSRAMGTLGTLWASRSNGDEFPIEASISHSDVVGKKLFTVIIRDITDRKRAEEELEELSGRLINAQEKERSLVARELHDDICQRLAMLSCRIERATKHSGSPPGRQHDEMKEIWEQCSNLAGDVQALSHELHSSILDHLGLVAAADNFCQEFSQQHSVCVGFTHRDVPNSLPQQLSLNLFRILQEGVRNAFKHSGVNRFSVCLEGTPHEVTLEIHDQGIGFDVRKAKTIGGIGLVSIGERVNILHGTLLIESNPHRGTKVRVSVPLAGTDVTAEKKAAAG